jgi:hypothetical protein
MARAKSAPILLRAAKNDDESEHPARCCSLVDATPLMPEALEKTVKELPRDPEVVELFNKLAGADPLPPR